MNALIAIRSELDSAAIAESAASSVEPYVSGSDRDAPAHGEPGEQVHVHSEHGHSGGVREWVARIGRLHPLSVHFPIALLLSAALVELPTIRRRHACAEHVVRFCLRSGAIGSGAAAALGRADALGVGMSCVGFDARVLAWHRRSGIATALLAVFALIAFEHLRSHGSPSSRRGCRALPIACALLVAGAGYLGGSLIHGWNHLFR